MSLTLKVLIGSIGGAHTTKSMRFAENMSVHETCKTIQEKVEDGGSGQDHGLFKPINEESGPKGGRWLRPEKTLESYDLKSGDFVEYRKKSVPIKVKIPGNAIKTFLVDQSLGSADVVGVIGQKMGIKNWEEYGLLLEGKEGDTDWLQKEQTVLEQQDREDQLLVFKRRYFVDANVDRDDPVSLHLIYVQSQDDIVAGKHPTAKDEAVQLAALQSQIDQGSMNPQSSKVDVKKVLAPQWQKEKGIDKAVMNVWKTLTGMSELNAKYRYVQFCRSLKTFGITTFQIKERPKGSKKLVPKVLGFTRDAILRMEEDGTIEKTYPLTHLKRWAASADTFTLDFGSHESDYVTVITQEGEAISQLIAGYIDILIKRRQVENAVVGDDEGDVATVSSVPKVSGFGVPSHSVSSYSNERNISGSVVDVDSAVNAVKVMSQNLFGEVAGPEDNANLSVEQRRRLIDEHTKNLDSLAQRMLGIMADPNGIDRVALNGTSKQISSTLEALIYATRNAVAMGMDNDGSLFDGVKSLADCLNDLFGTAAEVAKNPDQPDAKAKLLVATQSAQASLAKLAALASGNTTDDAFQKLFMEYGKAVQASTHTIASASAALSIRDPNKRNQVVSAAQQVEALGTVIALISNIMAPTAQDPTCISRIRDSEAPIQNAIQQLQAALYSAGVSEEDQFYITEAMVQLNEAFNGLLSCTSLPQMTAGQASQDFSASAQNVLEASNTLLASAGKPEVMRASVATISNESGVLVQAALALAETLDPASKARLQDYANRIDDCQKELVQLAPRAISNPKDDKAHALLRASATKLSSVTQAIVHDAGPSVALSALFTSAKQAAAAATTLVVSSRMAKGKMMNPQAEAALLQVTKAAADAITSLVESLQTANQEGGTENLMATTEKFARVAFQLVAAAKGSIPKITDPNVKKELGYSADVAGKSIQKLLVNHKATKAKMGSGEVNEALEQFQASEADLEATLLSVQQSQVEPSNETRENALRKMNANVKNVATAVKTLAAIVKDSPEELGSKMKDLSNAMAEVVESGKELIGTIDDPSLQRDILNNVKSLADDVSSIFQAAQAVALNPQDENLSKLLSDAGKQVATSLTKLVGACKGVIPKEVEGFINKSGEEIESLAEQELEKASNAISGAISKMQEAMEKARERKSTLVDLELDEAVIAEAILEACHAIGQSTSALVSAATSVQREFNSLMSVPETKAVYKRDPVWAQGLISAAREVAVSVKYLMDKSDKATKGELEGQEALIVAAKQVSQATTMLVTASTVKNVNSTTLNKLLESSKKVSGSTEELVRAANEAAKWKEEHVDTLPTKQDDYTMSEEKIALMNEQIEIMQLEAALAKKQKALMEKRKGQYVNANPNPTLAPARVNPPPGVPSPVPRPVQRGPPNKQTAPTPAPAPAPAPAPTPAPPASVPPPASGPGTLRRQPPTPASPPPGRAAPQPVPREPQSPPPPVPREPQSPPVNRGPPVNPPARSMPPARTAQRPPTEAQLPPRPTGPIPGRPGPAPGRQSTLRAVTAQNQEESFTGKVAWRKSGAFK